MNFLIPDDKNLTDAEIKKALECCMNGHCDDCPFRETREHCNNLDSLILDLINRQKAEIERLQEKLNTVKAMVNETIPLVEQELKTAKAEAYKEFAERVKIRFSGTLQCSGWLIQKVVEDIIEKMVGEDK